MSYPNQPGDGYGQQPQGQPPYGSGYSYGSPGQPPMPAGYPAPQYPYAGQPGYSANPSAPFGVDPMTGMPLSDKSKMTAGLLQIFLGGYGVGRFYLGYTNIAVAQLCLGVFSFLTVWFGIGFITGLAAGIWGLVDGIMILNGSVPDQYGRKLRD